MSLNLDLTLLRNLKRFLAKDMSIQVQTITTITITKEIHNRASLAIFMKMLREERKDKIKFIPHAWNLNVLLYLTQMPLNTITNG